MFRVVIATGLILALSFQTAVAAETWACQEIESTGLKLNGSKWQKTSFTLDPFMVKLDGGNSKFIQNGRTSSMECTSGMWSLTNCTDGYGRNVLLNTKDGAGAKSMMRGAALESLSGPRETIDLSVIQCTKF